MIYTTNEFKSHYQTKKYIPYRLYFNVVCVIVIFFAASIFVQKIYKPKHQFFKLPHNQFKKVVTVSRGDNLFSLLSPYKLDYTQIQKIVNAAKPHIRLQDLRVGQKVNLYGHFYKGKEILDFMQFFQTPETRVEIRQNTEYGYNAELVTIPLKKELISFNGVITSSLLEAANKAGVPYQNSIEAINALSQQIDFQRDIQKGDEFIFVVEKLIDPEDKTSTYNKTVYASLKNKKNALHMYLYKFPDGSEEFFNKNFTSARKSLIKTPVQATRISSGYGMRKHPVLGFSKMHTGIDFAAPRGTPVYAAGSGKIIRIGWNGGYGKYIKIKHNNKISTAYAHLSSYAKGVRRGQTVTQGQVIGRVGSTGRATGAHLHYEVLINNKHVNPLKVKVGSVRTLSGQDKQNLLNLQHEISKIL
ncbi:MAG: peptidoglycan DD-metalloendopeptidase family protein [Rickettsiales bacterium]